ncbi:MAG: pyrroline-5-carboxylate reductase [Candidatus Kaelpia aquatica]|nr:pyrroline-5-carboxylate reductase [Candidatus Kaelpia aquatica]
MNIGIIGLGKMGEAIVKGLIGSRGYKVYFNESDDVRCEEIIDKYRRLKCLDIEQLIDSSAVIILAVKPQDLKELLNKIGRLLRRDKLFISIAAGASIGFIQNEGSLEKVIRAMPNMGALVGESFTVLTHSEKVNDRELELAKKIFANIGDVKVVGEDSINAITAISGSGPAYFAYFLKSIEESAAEIGLGDISSKIALDTLGGTLKVLRELGISTDELIRMVKSPGGTTEACLDYWQQSDLSGIIKDGIKKAMNRAKELGR